MKKQVHVYYSGNVQGVGFRFTAEGIANKLGVTGWVKNLSDGKVEVVAEAPEATLKEFLTSIKRGMNNYIKDTAIDWSLATDGFSSFDIAF